ncbi:MAG: MarR family transcriptional regulator [Alphaproteobacteria bacterium]|nr:MarR family transcriptional regulator [Alphaproteobacteria bacterium]
MRKGVEDGVRAMAGARRSLAASDAATPAFDLAAFLPYRIVALGHVMGETLAEAYADESVGVNEWRTLAVIGQSRDSGVAARDVVARTPLDKMAVSRAVASLEAKGLIARNAAANDRRMSCLSLTADGRRVYERIVGIAVDYERRLLEALSTDASGALESTLRRLEACASALAEEG